MHHVRVALDDRVIRHLDATWDADSAEVITSEVDQHQMFGAFFGVGQEFDFESAIGGFICSARAGAGNRTNFAATSRQADVDFGRGADDVETSAGFHDEHVGRRVDVTQDAVEVERVAFEGDVGPSRKHDLDAITGADIVLDLKDGGFEAGLIDVGLAFGEIGDGR